jgi:hypothetical protein
VIPVIVASETNEEVMEKAEYVQELRTVLDPSWV